MQLIVEAIVVGIILLLVSIPAMGILHCLYPSDYTGCANLPPKSKTKYYVTTFLIGVITHLIFEYMGANKWYCKNGYACIADKNSEVTHPAVW